MNREIKLRAWCEDFEFKMCHYSYRPFDNGLWFEMNESFHSTEVHHIMQYTGVKDKNGKEIYEGGIIKYEYMLDTKTWTSFVEEVEWSEDKDSVGFNIHFTMPRYEVIGNIYENPELLNSTPNDNRSVATEDK